MALLRGINLGGRRLPMAELAEALRGLGFVAVTTYLQSGNAVFCAGGRPDQVAGSVEACLAERFGLEVPVLVRTRPEMERLVATNPFLAEGADPASLHVTFLAEASGPATRSLEPPPGAGRDRFVCAGREVFVHCPGGYGRTKLDNAFFERRLGTTATTRNWRTVTALVELAGRLEGLDGAHRGGGAHRGDGAHRGGGAQEGGAV